MSKNIRIRTEPNGGDKHVKIQLNQDFDFLEILSLKIAQEDVYRSFYSDYGVVVGRVIMNSGVGVPNARVSIFIPLTDEDSENPELSHIYPYSDISITNVDGVRYNTLPRDAQGVCHAPVGTFPTKRELIDNPELLEVYNKYFKYTTTTNASGDFMLFGVPVGNHILNVDVDLSDIGIFSQRPYDYIEQGNPPKLFESSTKFKSGTNLANLTQLKNRQLGVNVIPFWGEKVDNEIGISRIDVDLNYNIQPQAIFMGSIFGDNEKNSVNKTCRPRKKVGKICEMSEGSGSIQMLRKTIFGENERFDIEGGRFINDDGSWAYQVPMNLDYMVTDEFGVLIPSEDTTKGIPTRSRLRFKINAEVTGNEGRLRTKAKYLVPHNPENVYEIDYSFDASIPDIHFRDFYWNKIYTIKNHIARFQRDKSKENRNFIGFKDVDDCVGNKNPLPFNTIDTDFNPIFFILCLIMGLIIDIISIVNSIISFRLPIIGRVFPCRWCISITCPYNQLKYKPSCKKCGGNSSKKELKKCLRLSLAEALNVFEMDFYNDWINGSLYAYLLKYKKRKKKEKYCGDGSGDGDNFILNTNSHTHNVSNKDPQHFSVNEGVIVSYEDELFYKPISKDAKKLYPTDIFNLGAVFNCDWQSINKINSELPATTYQFPDFTDISLLFGIDCFGITLNNTQSENIKKMCEIGVEINEDTDNIINTEDISDALIRNKLLKLNNSSYYNTLISDMNLDFTTNDYSDYRNFIGENFYQSNGDSFYFYFGPKPNNTAIELMNNKYFTDCSKTIKTVINIIGVVTNVTTVNGENGSIAIEINGGSPEYTFLWLNSDGQIVPGSLPDESNVTGLSAGSYSVTVTDSNGIIAKKTFIISGLQTLSAQITTSPSQTNLSNGSININSIAGGVGPYSINISGGTNNIEIFEENIQSTFTLNDIPVGVYYVLIYDDQTTPFSYPNNGVPHIAEVNEPSGLVFGGAGVVSKNPTCLDADDGTISFTVEGGVPDYAITIRNESNTIVSTSETTSELPAGIYTINVIDSFNQVLAFGPIIFTNPNELILRKVDVFSNSYFYLDNTLSGVNYHLEKDDVPGSTVVGNGSTILIGISNDSALYIGISEDECTSNAIVIP